jgi:O-antigen/teichoic acid export membrane protein
MSLADSHQRDRMRQALSPAAKATKGSQIWAGIARPFELWSEVRNQSGELAWVIAGKFGLMGANALVMLFLANHLDLNTYGLFVITISAQLLTSRFLLVGVDFGMVRLTALPELRSRSQAVVTAGLVIIIVASALLAVFTLLIIPVLAQLDLPVSVLLCIVVGSIGTAFVDYGYSFRLARQEYPAAAIAQGGTAIWRVALTSLAALQVSAYPLAVFAAYHGSSLISGLVQSLLIARVIERPDRAVIKQLLRYSFWLGKANVIVIFSLYQGTFLLMMLNQPAATGLFGLGLTLSMGFFAISSAYTEYLQVRVRLVEHINDIPLFIRRSLAGALLLMLACVPVVFVVAKLLPWLLGPAWHPDVPVFIYLSASMVLLILQAPLSAICHYLLRPQLITLGWVMRVVLIGIAGLILAPQMGAIGAAIAQLIGSALALILLTWLTLRSLRSAMDSDGKA